MTNSSASGGYLLPSSTQGFPNNLTLTQFMQTVLVALSNLPGQFVRPKFQVNPPKQPDIETNWMAFSIIQDTADTFAYVGVNSSDQTELQRQETLEIQCSYYGPQAFENAELVRDGFQIQQNLEGLRTANMGYAEMSPARRIPDLVNERWVDRIEQSVFLRRQIQRLYPVLTLLSAAGTIHSVIGTESYLLDWAVPEEI